MMIHAYIYIHIHAVHYNNVCNYIHSIAWLYVILHYITLYYITFYCIALHYITLYYRHKTHTDIRVCVLKWMYVCMCIFLTVRDNHTIGCPDFRSVMSSCSRASCLLLPECSAASLSTECDVHDMRNEPRGWHRVAVLFARCMVFPELCWRVLCSTTAATLRCDSQSF